MPYSDTFDRLFRDSRPAVLAGRHECETMPVEGGSRFGLSVVLRPDDEAAHRLQAVGAEAQTAAGGGHWPSGDADLVHITVRTLETHRAAVPKDDLALRRYVTALRRAGRGPIGLRLTGLTLTTAGVMACAWPVDTAADAFAWALGDELGADGWFEAGIRRDIWYAMVLHFAGPIRSPRTLVDWVTARRRLDLGETTISSAQICQWVPDRRRPAPRVLASVAL
jgi:hypothetical protein